MSETLLNLRTSALVSDRDSVSVNTLLSVVAGATPCQFVPLYDLNHKSCPSVWSGPVVVVCLKRRNDRSVVRFVSSDPPRPLKGVSGTTTTRSRHSFQSNRSGTVSESSGSRGAVGVVCPARSPDKTKSGIPCFLKTTKMILRVQCNC